MDHPAAGHLILLYTTGRASGEIRRTPLRFFEIDGDLVVAGSYGGSPRHPDWYLNLLDDPRVWVRRDADLYEADAIPIEPGGSGPVVGHRCCRGLRRNSPTIRRRRSESSHWYGWWRVAESAEDAVCLGQQIVDVGARFLRKESTDPG